MSARFFKIFSGVLVGHLVIVSVVWVGFSAPSPRPPATFTYEGGLPADSTGGGAEDVWSKGKTSDGFAFDHLETPFNYWIKFRDAAKPTAYDHLGF